MTPITNNNIHKAVIAGQNSFFKKQVPAGTPVRSLIGGVSNMISELPTAQRELLGAFQNSLTNQTAESLQAQHLLYLQQQQQALQNNRFAVAAGNVSPPRGQPPLQMNPSSQQMASLRGKRPSQVDQTFPSSEPAHKRALGNFPGTGLPLNINQLSGLNPQQQLALMHMHQQGLASSTGLSMQTLQPPRPPGAQHPPHLNYSAAGFASPFNPQTNGVPNNDEVLQNYFQLIRTASTPIPRPPLSESQQMANIVAMINNNQQRASMEEHMRRQKELLQMQQAQQSEHPALHVAPSVRHEDPSMVIRASVHLHQQPQHHLLAVQNEQRRRSLSGAIPTANQQQYNLQLAVAQVAAAQAQQAAASAAAEAASAVTSTVPPLQLSPVVSLAKSPSTTYLLSPSNAQRSTPSSVSSNNHSTNIGPDDIRYQQFLRAVELFNKGVVEDEVIQHFDIPSPVAHAANATFRANIPMPAPSNSVEVAKKNSITHHEPSASANDLNKNGQSTSDPIVIVDNQV